MEWLKKHGDTITIIVAVVGAIAFSHYQLGNVHNQLVVIQGQISENQATLSEFIRGHEKAHLYIYGDIEDETPVDNGSADE